MKDTRKFLLDIILTIEELQSFSESFTLRDFENIENKWAVERGIAIIGEAAYKIWKIDNTHAISNWKEIIGTKHIIIHDYDRIDNEKLLIILKKHLPTLKSEVQKILDDIESQ